MALAISRLPILLSTLLSVLRGRRLFQALLLEEEHRPRFPHVLRWPVRRLRGLMSGDRGIRLSDILLIG